MAITEQRDVTVANHIIRLSDLKGIAHHLEELWREEKDKAFSRLTFQAQCDDNSAFSSSSSDIFLPDSVISRKRVIRVSMSFRSASYDKQVSIDLTHGGTAYANRILVSGDDSRWVNGTVTNLSEMLDAATPQNTFIHRHFVGLSFLLAIGYGHLIMPILNFVFRYLPPSNHTSDPAQRTNLQLAIIYCVYYIALIIMGSTPATFTMAKLKDLWPSIELQIGPEHLNVERLRRTWLGIAFAGGVLPFILSAGYDLFKYLWK